MGKFDKVYFDPLTLVDILSVCEVEKPEGVILELCGGDCSELTKALERENITILGYGSEIINKAQDKTFLAEAVSELGILIPQSKMSDDMEEAIALAQQIGYPVTVRPLNNENAKWETFYSSGVFRDYIETFGVSEKNPIIIESF